MKAKSSKAAHIGGSENRDHDDEVLSLFDVVYNAAGRHGNQLLAASLEVQNTGYHHLDLVTREISLH